jgi:hypothetical protein
MGAGDTELAQTGAAEADGQPEEAFLASGAAEPE